MDGPFQGVTTFSTQVSCPATVNDQMKCWGIININEKGACRIQVYSEGDRLNPREYDIHKYMKEGKDKIANKVVKVIQSNNLFIKDGHLAVTDLIISSTEDYESQKKGFKALGVLSNSIHFVKLPAKSQDPFVETVNTFFPNLYKMENSSVDRSTGHDDCQKSLDADQVKYPIEARRESSASSTSKREEKGIVKTVMGVFFNKNDDSDVSSPERSTGNDYSNMASNDVDMKKSNNKKETPASITPEKMDMSSNLDDHLAKKIDSLVSRFMTRVDELEVTLMKRLDKLENRMIVIEGKLDNEVPDLDYGQKQLRQPTPRKDRAPAIPKRPAFTDLPCHVQPAPVQVSQIQNQFTDKLKQKLRIERFQLSEDYSGPTLAFAVNGSRLHADIQRDLKSGTSNGPIFLLVIKPTMKPEEETEKLNIASMGFGHVKDGSFLLVDTNNKYLHDCDTNEESWKKAIQFLKDNNEYSSL